MNARSFARLAGVALIAALMPAQAFAQASITGVVRDTSGAVLPGVTVEAASPALIEKVRSSVTNDTGQFRIENLRPGIYSVTFTLGGFSSVKRDGVELQGSFSATINADLRVGEISETVTVTGESPIVDVQNTTQQRVLSHEIIDAIPTGRSDKNLATLIPGVSIAGGISQDVGGTQDQVSSQLTVHGSRGTDQRLTQNGVSLGITANGANTLIVATNLSAYQEVTIDTGAVSAELATGGVRVNYIPKDGGNRLSGTMVFGFGNGGMQSDNFSDELRAAGLGTPNALKRSYDYNPGVGGPILRDRLWFHVAYKKQSTEVYPAGMFTNLNANNPNAWTYAPDASSRPFNAVDGSDLHVRLTWQVLPKLKFGFSDQESGYCACTDGINATTSPEAALHRSTHKQRNLMGDWTAPLTNNLLIDGAFINRHQDQVRTVPPGNENPAMISVTDQALGNLVYRTVNVGTGNPALRDSWFSTMFVRSSLSYVTGGHIVKAGFTFGNGNEIHMLGNQLPGAIPYAYRFNNGVPNQVTLYGYPMRTTYRTNSDSGIYVQDKWTTGRMTLSGGLRFDHFANSAPESVAGPTAAAADAQPGVPGDRRRQLQGRHAEVRRRLRSHRQRHDGRQGEPEQVRAGPEFRRRHFRIGPDAHQPRRQRDHALVGRRRSRLSSRTATWRCPAPTASAAPWPTRTSAGPPAATSTTRPSWKAGACAATTGSSRPACSTRCCRACRST